MPLLWWAHARAGQPRTVAVASLQIWRRLDAARLASAERSQRRRWLELLLEASALVALTLAAAGPRWVRPAAGVERVALVVDNGLVMRTRLPGGTAWELARRAADERLAALGAGAQVQLVTMQGAEGWRERDAARRRLGELEVAPRPPEAVAPALRAARAWRCRVIYVARRPIPVDPVVEVIAVGPPESDNGGFVAVDGTPADGLWLVLGGAARRTRTVEGGGSARGVALTAGGQTTLRWSLEGAPERVELRLVGEDNLSDDDVLVARRRPALPVSLHGEAGLRGRLSSVLALLPEAERVDEGRLRIEVGGGLGDAASDRLLVFPRDLGERTALARPTYVARTRPSALLDGLDLSAIPVRARWQPPASLGLAPIAWSTEGDPLLLDGVRDGRRVTVVAFDARGWAEDPSFAIFVRRVVRQVDARAGRYVADPPLPGAHVTDNRGGVGATGSGAPGGLPPIEGVSRTDLRPAFAAIAAILLLASVCVRGRTPGPPESVRSDAR